MTQTRTGGPYIWATALAKLLTGENSCEWAGWFKAHHQGWTKPPSDFDRRHLDAGAHRPGQPGKGEPGTHRLRGLYREPEPLPLRGATATIAGKPDLIGEKHHEILISDAKTGRPSPSHPGPGPDLPVRGSQGPPAGSRAKTRAARSGTPTPTWAARPPRSVPSSSPTWAR